MEVREAIYESHGIMTSADKDNVVFQNTNHDNDNSQKNTNNNFIGRRRSSAKQANSNNVGGRHRFGHGSPSALAGNRNSRHHSVGSEKLMALTESAAQEVVELAETKVMAPLTSRNQKSSS